MSGIAFQKSNGDGSIAFAQLEELRKLNKSELYKLAKEFAPDLELTPVTKTWYIGFNENAENVINFDGRYFGYFYTSLSLMRTANSDNAYKSSWARVYDGNAIVSESTRMVHGDDILSWGNVNNHFLGFATAAVLARFDNHTNQHSFHVQFIGYKLGDEVPDPELPPIIQPVSKNVYFYGDSMTSGYGLGSAADSYPNLLCSYWGVTQNNFGVPWQSMQVYNPPTSWPDGNTGFVETCTTTVPVKTADDQYIFICFGFNDKQFTDNANLVNFERDYRLALNHIINDKGWSAPDIILLPIIHHFGKPDNADFQSVIFAMVAEFGTRFIDIRNEAITLSDGVHPNEAGHLWIYNQIKSYFE